MNRNPVFRFGLATLLLVGGSVLNAQTLAPPRTDVSSTRASRQTAMPPLHRSPFRAPTTSSSPSIDVPAMPQTYLQPVTDVKVAASDMGVIETMFVKRGEVVQRGDAIANLNDDVLQMALQSAQHAANGKASIHGAELEWQMRRDQHVAYKALYDDGDLSVRELRRSARNVEIAMAKLDERREQLQLKRLEHERVKRQIEKRRIVSPTHGVVVELIKNVGEFVSPTDPVVVRIIDLSMLKAVFDVPIDDAVALQVGQAVRVTAGKSAVLVQGAIASMVPMIDPTSGTMAVEVLIENQPQKLMPGWSCQWHSVAPAEKPAKGPAKVSSKVSANRSVNPPVVNLPNSRSSGATMRSMLAR